MCWWSQVVMVEWSEIVMVEYSCVGGVELSRVVMVGVDQSGVELCWCSSVEMVVYSCGVQLL